ncbi:hypothetical protein BN946_scf184798.g93 [Trametes cinnabarina]|uniref:Uncharacterized protein n=1 Tax=Pycnoporus cinnabarinus TaxID=5643 RepID=A0A060SEH7_PYCCI|nr:hypothetical protein BN946_scf184798.g93 [Trametes cinnabarina]
MRSPRRREYSPEPPPRRRSPKRSPAPKRKRSLSLPSRSRSRTRSPTQTPPPKRHVLPAPKSPTRPPAIPPVPRPITPLQTVTTDVDGDITMEEPLSFARFEATTPAEEPGNLPAPAPSALHVPSPVLAEAGAPSPVATTPTILSLPPKPEVDHDQKSLRRRPSRSPPTGPRHYAPTPPNATPPQTTQSGPSLPPKPEWTRRSNAPQQVKAKTESPLPSAAPEPVDSGPVIPPYQPKFNPAAEIEAEIVRTHAHRIHLEAEYVQTSAAARRALHEYDMSNIDVKAAMMRRELAVPQLEKAEVGMLGVDYMP